jgi:hypothetical protein
VPATPCRALPCMPSFNSQPCLITLSAVTKQEKVHPPLWLLLSFFILTKPESSSRPHPPDRADRYGSTSTAAPVPCRSVPSIIQANDSST